MSKTFEKMATHIGSLFALNEDFLRKSNVLFDSEELLKAPGDEKMYAAVKKYRDQLAHLQNLFQKSHFKLDQLDEMLNIIGAIKTIDWLKLLWAEESNQHQRLFLWREQYQQRSDEFQNAIHHFIRKELEKKLEGVLPHPLINLVKQYVAG